MPKYTDEQIKKAKAHFKYGIDCDIFSEPVLTYAKIALDAIDALDLISRYEAEIERLKEENAKLEDAKNAYKDIVDTCEVGAAKMLAERLKEHCVLLAKDEWYNTTSPSSWAGAYECFTEDIDNITKEFVKEMVGESVV